MSKPVINIFCEGNYDNQVMKKIAERLEQVCSPIIVQSGGVRGMTNFMDGYKAGDAIIPKDNIQFALRDRDFDFPQKEGNSLNKVEVKRNTDQKITKVVCVTNRTTIENYLIKTDSMMEWKPELLSGLTKPDLDECLVFAARKISAYQTVRHALGATRRTNSLSTKWTEESGKLPASLDEKDCLEKAHEKISDYDSICSEISKAKFDQHYESFKKIFESDQFYEAKEFLIYFQGKDLISAFQKQLALKGLTNFPMRSFLKHQAKNTVPEDFPDFLEFVDEVKKHLKT